MRRSEPRNFGRSQTYPLAGERIGPAWREAWIILCDTHPRFSDGVVLRQRVASKHGLSEHTVGALLARAAKDGQLEVDYRRPREAGRTRAFYRIKSS